MKLNWNFLEGGGAKQKPSMGEGWVLFGTTHCQFVLIGHVNPRDVLHLLLDIYIFKGNDT